MGTTSTGSGKAPSIGTSLESAVNQIAGVVTVGLFARRRADVLIIAGDSGARILEPALNL